MYKNIILVAAISAFGLSSCAGAQNSETTSFPTAKSKAAQSIFYDNASKNEKKCHQVCGVNQVDWNLQNYVVDEQNIPRDGNPGGYRASLSPDQQRKFAAKLAEREIAKKLNGEQRSEIFIRLYFKPVNPQESAYWKVEYSPYQNGNPQISEAMFNQVLLALQKVGKIRIKLSEEKTIQTIKLLGLDINKMSSATYNGQKYKTMYIPLFDVGEVEPDRVLYFNLQKTLPNCPVPNIYLTRKITPKNEIAEMLFGERSLKAKSTYGFFSACSSGYTTTSSMGFVFPKLVNIGN